MEKKYPGKVRASVKRDLTLLKNSIEKSKSVYMKINYLTQQGSHVHKTGISLWWDVSFLYKRFIPLCRGVFVYKVHV